MKLYYYKGHTPNFGDELNTWMWPRLLPDFFDGHDNELFLGIGSILFDFHPPGARKIVFGAGYGGYTAPPKLDARWDMYFVRGPITARAIGVDDALGVGDAAILLRSCVSQRPAQRYKASFMPHWESTFDGRWQEVCAAAGLHYIDPCADVEQVLDEIQASGVVVTEAMHGAIVADALRVPWVPARPIQRQHRLKWLDWALALRLDLHPLPLQPSTGLEAAMSWFPGGRLTAARLRRRAQFLKPAAADYFHDTAARSLQELASAPPSLSRDEVISNAHQIMLDQLGVLQSRGRH
ncbi:MAG: polysaccharide pyruvyl transferase family protein [Rhodocyclaceae bacterium]